MHDSDSHNADPGDGGPLYNTKMEVDKDNKMEVDEEGRMIWTWLRRNGPRRGLVGGRMLTLVDIMYLHVNLYSLQLFSFTKTLGLVTDASKERIPIICKQR